MTAYILTAVFSAALVLICRLYLYAAKKSSPARFIFAALGAVSAAAAAVVLSLGGAELSLLVIVYSAAAAAILA